MLNPSIFIVDSAAQLETKGDNKKLSPSYQLYPTALQVRTGSARRGVNVTPIDI